VANHISHFDPFFLSFSFRRVIDWMTTEEFYENPFEAAGLRAVNTFPVNRKRPDRRALRLGVERLRAGRFVGVFPDGGIRAGETSILGGVTPKSGATALARLAGVPIIPCVIFGTDRLYASRTWRPGPPRTPVWVAIGGPVSILTTHADRGNSTLAEALREIGSAAIAHFNLRPDDLPMTPQRRRRPEAESFA
jgi:1-acyl-sn-glycerol-3-phosphate acyltransferase